MIGSNALQISLGHTVSAYLSLGMTVITLANPIVTMYFVRPYREGLLYMLHIRKKAAVTPVATTVVGSCFEPATCTAFPGTTVTDLSEIVG